MASNKKSRSLLPLRALIASFEVLDFKVLFIFEVPLTHGLKVLFLFLRRILGFCILPQDAPCPWGPDRSLGPPFLEALFPSWGSLLFEVLFSSSKQILARFSTFEVLLSPIKPTIPGRCGRLSPLKVWYLSSGPSRCPWDIGLVCSNDDYVSPLLQKKNMDSLSWTNSRVPR